MLEKCTFTISVNYDDSRWCELNSGHYTHWFHPNMIVLFPINRRGTANVTMCYVILDPESDARKALEEIRKLGLRCPNRAEAETFFDQYPEEQNKFPIVALCGSVTGNGVDRRIGYVSAHDSEHDVGEKKLGRGWAPGCRFLAVAA